MICCSNHPLKIKDPENESALFRRVEYLPFSHPLDGKICNIDMLLKDKAWIVKNAIFALSEWVERGCELTEIQLPDDFFTEDSIAKSNIDHIGLFVTEHTITEEGAFSSIDDLYNAYIGSESYMPLKKDTFSKKTSELLAKFKGRKGDLRGYKGIKII